MRSVAVIVFIGLVTAVALYCAQRPTIARGSVLASSLVQSNPLLAGLDCDAEVPIGTTGATFQCKATFKNGDEADYRFHLDRAGMIQVVDQGDTRSAPRIKKTTDPWGD
jgi:hypothetical protein